MLLNILGSFLIEALMLGVGILIMLTFLRTSLEDRDLRWRDLRWPFAPPTNALQCVAVGMCLTVPVAAVASLITHVAALAWTNTPVLTTITLALVGYLVAWARSAWERLQADMGRAVRIAIAPGEHGTDGDRCLDLVVSNSTERSAYSVYLEEIKTSQGTLDALPAPIRELLMTRRMSVVGTDGARFCLGEADQYKAPSHPVEVRVTWNSRPPHTDDGEEWGSHTYHAVGVLNLYDVALQVLSAPTMPPQVTGGAVVVPAMQPLTVAHNGAKAPIP